MLFDGNAAHGEWCVDYLAVIVKRPWAKTGIVPLFTGAQGAGKNTVFDFFRTRILGDAISAQLQNPREGIFDRFGTAHKNRIFLQIDEVRTHASSGVKSVKFDLASAGRPQAAAGVKSVKYFDHFYTGG